MPKAEDSLLAAVYLNNIDEVKKHLADPVMVRKELNPACPPDAPKCKPVTVAAENGNIPIMKLLLDAGADIEGATKDTGDTPLILAIIGQRKDMVKFLIDRGANVNKPNKFGATPFWGSCASGQTELAKLFIEKGAHINEKGKFPDPLLQKPGTITGITPLMIAASGGYDELVEVLIRNDADPLMKDSAGRNALAYAKAKDHPSIAGQIEAAMKQHTPL